MSRLLSKHEKNSDFYQACETVRSNHKGYLSTKEIASIAEESECSSFYMSSKYIKRLLWEMNTDRHTLSKFTHIKEKHTEIYNRYKLLLSEHPGETLTWYAEEISYQRAPRFYLDKNYATILYYKLMNKKV